MAAAVPEEHAAHTQPVSTVDQNDVELPVAIDVADADVRRCIWRRLQLLRTRIGGILRNGAVDQAPRPRRRGNDRSSAEQEPSMSASHGSTSLLKSSERGLQTSPPTPAINTDPS
jgi:hypothetical protein